MAVTVAVSLVTKPKHPKELEGLVYGLTALPAEREAPLYERPWVWATAVGAAVLALNVVFW